MPRTTRSSRRPAPIKRLSCDAAGIYKWKPDPGIRGAFKAVSLGRERKFAESEARRLNDAVELWRRQEAEKALQAPAKPLPRARGPLTFSQLANRWTKGGDGKGSDAWRGLRESTRKQYAFYLAALEIEFGDEIAGMLRRGRVRHYFDPLKRRAPGTARSYAACGRSLYKWAIDTEEVALEVNPFSSLGVGSAGKRTRRMSFEDLRHLVAVADGRVNPPPGPPKVQEEGGPRRRNREWMPRPSIGTGLVLAFGCIQRITDVIELADEHLVALPDGSVRLTFDQSKSRRVGKNYELDPGISIDMRLPPIVAQRLRDRPDPVRIPSGHLMVNERTKRPYTRHNVSQVYNLVLARAIAVDPRRWGHLAGLQARDGRRSGFVHLRKLKLSVEEIVNMSGHSLDEGFRIVEHYLPRTAEEADAAAAHMTGEL